MKQNTSSDYNNKNCKENVKEQNSNVRGQGRRSNRSGKANGRNNSHKQKNKELDVGSKMRGDINNPAYYYEDANVLSQVMNFSFNEFGGVPISMDQDGTKWTMHNTMLAVFFLNPSIPQTSSASEYVMDGVTTAALRNYLALSGSNNKTTQYGPQDVILTILGVAELIKASTAIARAFGVAYLFNYRNRVYPEALLNAMGINVPDFNSNLAAYRVRFNKLLTMASKIPFPADIPLFKKAADLYAYIYLDDDNSALAQSYFMMPNSVWRFNETYNDQGSGLDTFKLFTYDNQTMGEILDGFESMISALLNSTSLNAIYSDIMRLVQNGKLTNLITFKSIPEDFVVVPVYNPEVKDWLHNAIVMGYPLSKAATYQPTGMDPFSNLNDVSCDANTNKLFYHPQFELKGSDVGTGLSYGRKALLDFDHDNVTIEDKVKATRFAQRFTALLNQDSESGYLYNRMVTGNLAFNDEYVTDIWFYTGETFDSAPSEVMDTSFADLRTTNLPEVLLKSDTLSKFDWAPLCYYINDDTHQMTVIGDVDYYTVVEYETLRRIFDYEIIHLLQIG